MKYLFLDTNIFIHYKGYEDIPWKTLLGTSDEVSVVLASIIIREINGHKDSSKGRVRNKARKISEKFNKILLKNQQSRVPLFHCRETPIQDNEKTIFDLTVNDDRFLLNVLHSPYPKEDVYVVSNDTDLLLKAKESGLNILLMDDTFGAAEEPTEEEKELKKVKEELARWTNRCSNPQILFSDNDSDCLGFKLIQHESVEEFVEQKVLEESLRYPEEKEEPITYDNILGAFQQQMTTLANLYLRHTPEEKACFNQMRTRYLSDYRKKEALQAKKEMLQNAFKRLKIKVINGGTAPTGDLYIVLRFPRNVNFYTLSESVSKYEYEPPVKPQYNQMLASMSGLSSINMLGGYPDYSITMWNPDKPSSKFEYVSRLSNLTHGLQSELKNEIFIDTRERQDFEIEWCIADSSLLDHKHGKLRVVVSNKN